jgi:FtsH-binding integral membrane protein
MNKGVLMANYQTTVRRGVDARAAAQIDEGLRAYLNKVYALMGVAMIITGVVAYVIGADFANLVDQKPTMIVPENVLVALFSSPLRYVVIFAPLGVVFLMGARIHRMSTSSAQTTFWIFSGLMGLSIAWIFAVYTGVSIAQTFFATAVAFLGLSLYGYTTKRNLSGMGSFLMMGLIGLIVASIANIFIGSSGLGFAISVIGVLIFAALTAFDTQRLKNEYIHFSQMGPQGEAYLEKGAIMGALGLYLNFLNMFMFLLQFMGASRN